MADLIVKREGTLFLFDPQTEAGHDWLNSIANSIAPSAYTSQRASGTACRLACSGAM